MTDNMENLIDYIYATVKSDFPGYSAFRVKAAILDALRAYGNEQADMMLHTAQLTQIVKNLAQLARLS